MQYASSFKRYNWTINTGKINSDSILLSLLNFMTSRPIMPTTNTATSPAIMRGLLRTSLNSIFIYSLLSSDNGVGGERGFTAPPAWLDVVSCCCCPAVFALNYFFVFSVRSKTVNGEQ